MTADISLAVDQFAIVVLLKILLLLVREDDIASECLRHQKVLAERARAAPKHLVGVSWDNGAEGKDEVVNHLHVKEIGGYRVRDRVLSKLLGPLTCVGQH